MSPHFFESKIFALIMLFATVAVLAVSAWLLYPPYQAQARLEAYTPSQSAIKLGEDVQVKHRSNKRGAWSEHIPCLTLQLREGAAPLTACKATGFVDAPEAARQFLATHYGKPSGFTVYVSPDQSHVSLDGFSAERTRSALLPLVLIGVLVPAVEFGTWVFLRRLVRRRQGKDSPPTGPTP